MAKSSGRCARLSEVLEVPSRFEVDDELWAEVQPLLPVIERRRRYPGRRRLDDRAALNGILFGCIPGSRGEICLLSSAMDPA